MSKFTKYTTRLVYSTEVLFNHLQIAGEAVRIAFEGKNPKNQSETLNWLSQAIFDFGFT